MEAVAKALWQSSWRWEGKGAVTLLDIFLCKSEDACLLVGFRRIYYIKSSRSTLHIVTAISRLMRAYPKYLVIIQKPPLVIANSASPKMQKIPPPHPSYLVKEPDREKMSCDAARIAHLLSGIYMPHASSVYISPNS
ncbi:hypothetical protein VTH06DRAFT_6536 [Thermothelomyces fergusii]